MTAASSFAHLRSTAARAFAQTMIVVDDEATHDTPASEAPTSNALRRPDRWTRSQPAAATSDTDQNDAAAPLSHTLDAKTLIDKSMELGVLCSVLRPNAGENFAPRVVNAAQIADIVCLDWDLHNDSGTTASRIIRDIVRQDARNDGRLRLVAVYTGDTTNPGILDKILNAIPLGLRKEHHYDRGPLEITSKNGVKIICLFKAHALKVPPPGDANQISEKQLPERLQAEFAQLSEGLLSNVALGTVASIRRSAHHVLAKFTGQMDGPFFHHRALIETPEDAEEYAVDVVLAELKAAVRKEHVAAKYAGPTAIAERIRELAGSSGTLRLKGPEGGFDLALDHVTKLIVEGLQTLNQLPLHKPPGRNRFRNELTSLFSEDAATARKSMHAFAALTGLRAYPGSHPYRTGQLRPNLGLGTVVQEKARAYLLCLQASCDSIRLKGERSFLFVPLDVEDREPEHVVPVPHKGTIVRYVGLGTSNKSYSVARSICFTASGETGTVVGKRISRRSGIYFEDTTGKTYRWIADLKRRRALRTVQRLTQQMGRLGFDEFEPYRRRQD